MFLILPLILYIGITLDATIDGNMDGKIYKFLSTNFWGMKSDGQHNTNVVVVNNNDTSAKQKEDLLKALQLSQKNSKHNIDDFDD